MNLTEKELEQITDIVAEKILLQLPSVISNLMDSYARMSQINQKFYKDFKEFSNHREIVMQVMEQVDSSKPGQSYEELIKTAVPIIRQRVKTTNAVNMNYPKPIDRNKRHGDL